MNEWIYSLDRIKVSQAETPRHDNWYINRLATLSTACLFSNEKTFGLMTDKICSPYCNLNIAFSWWHFLTLTFELLTSKTHHCCVRFTYSPIAHVAACWTLQCICQICNIWQMNLTLNPSNSASCLNAVFCKYNITTKHEDGVTICSPIMKHFVAGFHKAFWPQNSIMTELPTLQNF